MSELMLDVGQANELKLALRRGGWNNADIKMFCENSTAVSQVLGVVRGVKEIRPIEGKIDLTSGGRLPNLTGAQLKSYVSQGIATLEFRGGNLFLDGQMIVLYLTEKQRSPVGEIGIAIREQIIRNKTPMSAALLDHLMDHPEMWPWKGNARGETLCVPFWASIYSDPHNEEYVRYGYWDKDRVRSLTYPTHTILHERSPAAVIE